MDRRLVVARRRGQGQAAAAGVDDHRDAIGGAEPIGQQMQALTHQRQLVGRAHRARHVDEEDEVAAGGGAVAAAIAPVGGADADQGEQVVLVPRTGPDLGRDRDRRVAGRRRVVEPEIVDELFDADGAGRRQTAFSEHPPDVGVGRGVDVGREGRPRLGADAMKPVFRQVPVGLTVVAERAWPDRPALWQRVEGSRRRRRLDRQLLSTDGHGLGQRSDLQRHGDRRGPPRDDGHGGFLGLEPRELDADPILAGLQAEHVEDAALVGDGLRLRLARSPYRHRHPRQDSPRLRPSPSPTPPRSLARQTAWPRAGQRRSVVPRRPEPSSHVPPWQPPLVSLRIDVMRWAPQQQGPCPEHAISGQGKTLRTVARPCPAFAALDRRGRCRWIASRYHLGTCQPRCSRRIPAVPRRRPRSRRR